VLMPTAFAKVALAAGGATCAFAAVKVRNKWKCAS
jgi:hypothetical protein